LNFYEQAISQPIQVAARSNEWIYDRSLAGIVGLSPAGDKVVCLLCCVPWGRGPCVGPVSRPKGVLVSVFYLSVIEKRHRSSLGPPGPSSHKEKQFNNRLVNPLNPELNPICYLLALLEAHHFLRVSRIRVKSLNFRRLMSYIYIYIWSTHSWCF
jgi:hypothetical protein